MESPMRPASPRAVALWITVLSLLAALFSLSGLALAQAAAGPKRKASQQSAQQGPIAGSRAAARKARSKATTDTWTGGGGSGNTDWSDASNWNNGAIVSGENIAINATTAATWTTRPLPSAHSLWATRVIPSR